VPVEHKPTSGPRWRDAGRRTGKRGAKVFHCVSSKVYPTRPNPALEGGIRAQPRWRGFWVARWPSTYVRMISRGAPPREAAGQEGGHSTPSRWRPVISGRKPGAEVQSAHGLGDPFPRGAVGQALRRGIIAERP